METLVIGGFSYTQTANVSTFLDRFLALQVLRPIRVVTHRSDPRLLIFHGLTTLDRQRPTVPTWFDDVKS